MPYESSCTYKVFSECSWPKFEVNSTEVDLWVTSFKGKKNDKPDSDDSAIIKKADKSNGKVIAEPDSSNRTADCD